MGSWIWSINVARQRKLNIRNIQWNCIPKTYSKVSEKIVPLSYEAWARDILDRINSIPYLAYVALINGCSRIKCGNASMEVKSPILVYEYVFRPAILKNEL